MPPLDSDRRRAELARAVGSVALARAEFETAKHRFEEARDLFGRVQDARGQADTIKLLGDVAMGEDQAASALAFYEDARRRYMAIGDATLAEGCRGYAEIASAKASRQEAKGPEQLFLAHLPIIDAAIAFVARRYHLSRQESEDFASVARLRLIEKDYAVLRSYQGQSSLRTFLTSVVLRICLDYRQAQWGKWRPSVAARKSGQLGEVLERLIVRDGLSESEAIALLSINMSSAVSRVGEDELHRIATDIRATPLRRMVTEDILRDMPAFEYADAGVARADAAALSREVREALKETLSRLSEEDRHILRLRFNDNMPTSRIAETLSVDQRGLYRRLQRITDFLRTNLEERGFSAADIVTMLANDNV